MDVLIGALLILGMMSVVYLGPAVIVKITRGARPARVRVRSRANGGRREDGAIRSGRYQA